MRCYGGAEPPEGDVTRDQTERNGERNEEDQKRFKRQAVQRRSPEMWLEMRCAIGAGSAGVFSV